MSKIETDAFGGTTIISSPEETRKARELAVLLRPDHACTGMGGIGTKADGCSYSYSRPCTGCVAQQERVRKQRPDLFPKPEAKPRVEWYPKVNTVEYRNAVMPHLRHLLGLYEKNGTVMDDEVRYFLDQVLIITQDAVEHG